MGIDAFVYVRGCGVSMCLVVEARVVLTETDTTELEKLSDGYSGVDYSGVYIELSELVY